MKKKKFKEMKIKMNYVSNFETIDELMEDHYNIFEYSEMFLNVKIKTIEEFKIIFINIPNDIFGQGIAYGFGDSVVRDDLYNLFEKENYESLLNNYNEYLEINNEK